MRQVNSESGANSLLIANHLAHIVVHPMARLIIASHRDIGQETGNEELNPDQAEENTDERPEAFGQRGPKNKLFHQHPSKDGATKREEKDTDAAEQMEWSMGILAPKPNGQHVDKAFHATLPIVLRHAMNSRMMTYLYLGYFEAFKFKDGWNEAVHLAEKVDVFEALTAVGLQAATGIMDMVMDEDFTKEIRNARRNLLAPRILALITPARHDIIALIDLFDEERDIVRVILEITVERDDDIARCRLDAGIKSRGLTEIFPKNDELHWDTSLGFEQSSILRPIINKDNLIRITDFFERCLDPTMQLKYIPLFVIKRDND